MWILFTRSNWKYLVTSIDGIILNVLYLIKLASLNLLCSRREEGGGPCISLPHNLHLLSHMCPFKIVYSSRSTPFRKQQKILLFNPLRRGRGGVLWLRCIFVVATYICAKVFFLLIKIFMCFNCRYVATVLRVGEEGKVPSIPLILSPFPPPVKC